MAEMQKHPPIEQKIDDLAEYSFDTASPALAESPDITVPVSFPSVLESKDRIIKIMKSGFLGF